MSPMTRDEVLWLMGRSVVEHLSRADLRLVLRALREQPGRMEAYINAPGPCCWRSSDFAAFSLRCAKRVLAGGEA